MKQEKDYESKYGNGGVAITYGTYDTHGKPIKFTTNRAEYPVLAFEPIKLKTGGYVAGKTDVPNLTMDIPKDVADTIQERTETGAYCFDVDICMGGVTYNLTRVIPLDFGDLPSGDVQMEYTTTGNLSTGIPIV
jgi:hypothetical protein